MRSSQCKRKSVGVFKFTKKKYLGGHSHKFSRILAKI
jgi:hypothetical protein